MRRHCRGLHHSSPHLLLSPHFSLFLTDLFFLHFSFFYSRPYYITTPTSLLCHRTGGCLERWLWGLTRQKSEGKKEKKKTRAESRRRLKLSPSSFPHQLSSSLHPHLLSSPLPSPPSPSFFLSFSLHDRVALVSREELVTFRKPIQKDIISFVSPATIRSAFLDSFRPSPPLRPD